MKIELTKEEAELIGESLRQMEHHLEQIPNFFRDSHYYAPVQKHIDDIKDLINKFEMLKLEK